MDSTKIKVLTEITINKIKIDNKYLTKSLFNQLVTEVGFSRDYKFEGKLVLGYYKGNDFWFGIYVNNAGQLRKHQFDKYITSKFENDRYFKEELSPEQERRKRLVEDFKNQQIFL